MTHRSPPSKKIQMSVIDLGSEELQAAQEVLLSGYWREGPKTRQFENNFAQYTGAQHAMAVSSGTAALHLCYAALLKPGDEVLVPSFTFIATASMIVHAGGIPVFCDINPQTWLISPDEILKKITPRTRLIAGVHLFGNVCDIQAISAIACKHQLKVIWDAAQSLGAEYQQKPVAQYGDAVCFSFYPSKNMSVGEGGMITTQDDALAAKLRLLKDHGRTGKYVHTLTGFNYRMSEVEAAIGTEQLKKIDRFLKRRREITAIYDTYFKKNDAIQTQRLTPGAEHACNYYSLALNSDRCKVSRDQVLQDLQKAGIPTAVHYPVPLHEQPCFASLNGNAPVSKKLSEMIFSLPMHSQMEAEEAHYIAEQLQGIVSS